MPSCKQPRFYIKRGIYLIFKKQNLNLHMLEVLKWYVYLSPANLTLNSDHIKTVISFNKGKFEVCIFIKNCIAKQD